MNASDTYQTRMVFVTFLQYFLIIPVVYAFTLQVNLGWWISAALLSIVLSAYGFNIAIHHTFCHRIFKFPRPIEIVLMYVGTIACGSSPICWSVYHGAHHKYADTELDPNSPFHLKWKAFFFCCHRTKRPDFKGMKHLFEDKAQLFFNSHKGFWITTLSWPIVVTIIFGLNGLIFLWAIPLFYSLTAALIFTLSHIGPKDKSGSRALNTWILHIVSFGDGDHQDHHQNWNVCGWLPRQFARVIGGKYK